MDEFLKTTAITPVNRNPLKALLIILSLIIPLTMAAPNEASGNVTQVVDADTLYIQSIGKVRLADIYCPESNRPGGPEAKAYVEERMLGKEVWLDIDNKSRIDNNEFKRLVCVVYLKAGNGSLQNFNRVLVDSGHACIQNYKNNEFDPAGWWVGGIPDSACIESTNGSMIRGDVRTLGLIQPIGKKFIGSIKTKKYHNPKCKHTRAIKPENTIWFASADEAKAQGYEPCVICSRDLDKDAS